MAPVAISQSAELIRARARLESSAEDLMRRLTAISAGDVQGADLFECCLKTAHALGAAEALATFDAQMAETLLPEIQHLVAEVQRVSAALSLARAE